MAKISVVPMCALAAWSLAPVHAQIANETVLHTFAGSRKGTYPLAGVVRGPAGNLFGTASEGGTGNWGVVYRVDPGGHEIVLYKFTGGADGGAPYAGVIADAAGNLYGTTSAGGTAGVGVVYKLDTTGHETVLYTFTGGADGLGPDGGVVRDSAGNLYGTTVAGGTANMGVVYELDTTGHETVLYNFSGGRNGDNPRAGVTRDSAGNLFGIAEGGMANEGVVYKLSPAGAYGVLHSFTGGADGGNPTGQLLGDGAGNLYGTANSGGTLGSGVLYKLDSAGVETVLHNFGTGAPDGRGPVGGVFRDSAGNLYGTTEAGGPADLGTVYKLDTAGNATVLYSFTGGNTGEGPNGGLVGDSAGNLYGTTDYGGDVQVCGTFGNGCGVVYKVDTSGHETVLYTFTNGIDGSYPLGVVRTSAGSFFGTTQDGGMANVGVVYEIDSTGREKILHNFTGRADGGSPSSGVVGDGAGNLYGATLKGGTAKAGVVYKLDTTGHETVLYSFTGGADGGYPNGDLLRDSAGNLFGTTGGGGGPANAGVVYELDAAGNETVLHTFTGANDGNIPLGKLIADAAGNLYGTTYNGGATGWGVVFKLDTAGNETVLYNFTGGADGGIPNGGLTLDSAGNLYGTTNQGGTGVGVVFLVNTAGQERVLYTFTGGDDGDEPQAGVIREPAGNLYGTTWFGGSGGKGVAYKLDAAGNETVLYNFTGGADGGSPAAGLIADPAGNLYGTASVSAGETSGGVLFKLTPVP